MRYYLFSSPIWRENDGLAKQAKASRDHPYLNRRPQNRNSLFRKFIGQPYRWAC
jgi:hypothetical protein